MSKRFGRNQKRRMKQEIAALSAVSQRYAENEQRVQGRLRECMRVIELTADVLGQHFCTLPPKVIQSHGLDRSHIYHLTKPDKFPFARQNTTDKELISELSDALHELYVYPVQLQTDELRDQVHVRIQGPRDECYGYALSAEMKRMYPKNRLIELVSRELAMMMVEHWK